VIFALAVLCSGMTIVGGLLALRFRAGRLWADELQRYRLQLPASLTTDDVSRWLGMVAAMTSMPRWFVRPPSVLALEIRASCRGGIAYFLYVPKHTEATALQSGAIVKTCG
jgi:hypothetical protein